MSPFEIRLDLLKMAENNLVQKYHMEKDAIQQNWLADCENMRAKGEDTRPCPELPNFPTEIEIIAKAKVLNQFVSNS